MYNPPFPQPSDILPGWHVIRDGNSWCALGPEFTDWVVSVVGWGDSPDEAVADLKERRGGRQPSSFTKVPSADAFVRWPG